MVGSSVLASRDVGVAKIAILDDGTTDCEMLLDDDTRHRVTQSAADHVMRLWEQKRHVIVRVDITLVSAPRRAAENGRPASGGERG